eukprot:4975206-Pyramimonas_sp.AAC.1
MRSLRLLNDATQASAGLSSEGGQHFQGRGAGGVSSSRPRGTCGTDTQSEGAISTVYCLDLHAETSTPARNEAVASSSSSLKS